MKKLFAVVMSAAMLAAFTPIVEAQTNCPAEVAQAKEMLAKKGSTARDQSVQAPRSLAGARQSVQAPRDQNVQAPRDQNVQAPRDQNVQAPRDQNVQAPRDQNVQAPRDRTSRPRVPRPVPRPAAASARRPSS